MTVQNRDRELEDAVGATQNGAMLPGSIETVRLQLLAVAIRAQMAQRPRSKAPHRFTLH